MAAPRDRRFRIRIRTGDGDTTQEIVIEGRDGWALHKLIIAGEEGCAYIDTPGPRWSSYVHKLRNMGFVIETVTETHGGTFAGRHARYVLRSTVVVLEVHDPQARVVNGTSLPAEARA